MRFAGNQLEIVIGVEDVTENAIAQIEVFGEVVTAKLDAREVVPVVEWIRIRIAPNGIREQLLTAAWKTLSMLGKPVNTLVFYQDDATLVAKRLG